MTTDYASRARILDVREERKAVSRFEFREDAGSGNYVLEGYAATFTPYDVYGGPKRGGWVEQLTPRAFDRTLQASPDVQLLVNHEGWALARTTAGTLTLAADGHGLRVRAMLDRADPDVQRLVPKLKPQPGTNRANMDEMSFAFRVKDQVWDDNYTNRTITEVSLHKGDVSVVNFGMNPGTRAMLAQGVDALSSLSHKELVELRRLDPDLMHRAELALATVIPEKRGWRADGEHDLTDGRCLRCESDEARAKTPSEYSGVSNFADPGYLDSEGNPAKGGNGVKRYPLDEKHVMAAWGYINQPKNQKGYSPTQLAAVKSKIKAAMKRFGHEVSDDDKAAASLPGAGGGGGYGNDVAPMVGLSHVDMVRNLDGGTTLVAVLMDGSRVALPAAPASNLTTGGRPTPGDARLGGMFPYIWNPFGQANPNPPDGRSEDGGDEEPDEDEHDEEKSDRAFPPGKKAAPFKKGGGHEGDSEDDGEDEGRALPDVADEMGEYEGTDTKAVIAAENDEDEHEDEVTLSAGPINIERMLHEFRGQAGIPEVETVSDGLAYLRRA